MYPHEISLLMFHALVQKNQTYIRGLGNGDIINILDSLIANRVNNTCTPVLLSN